MKMEKIMEILGVLAKSGEFYNSLYAAFMDIKSEEPVFYDGITKQLEAKKFSGVLDIVTYFGR